MAALNRRSLLKSGAAGAAAWSVSTPWVSAFAAAAQQPARAADPGERIVRMSGDGVGLTAPEYARLLARLVDERHMTPDSFSLGGIVEDLEGQFARVLGKERAIFMPTGTLANHLAVRALAAGPSRVVVQDESHFYQDEGDCGQTLSGLTLVPLGAGRATFTADDVQAVLDRTKGARVVPRVSVISIETPVRRRQGERFDGTEMRKVIALARREGIKLHLDGARLFLQAGYTGEDVAETARPFDTVYVSLYKYFNAASGAILAGPRSLLDGMYHTRRMFGGGLNHVWPFAAVAQHYLAGFDERFSRAVRTSEEVIRALGQQGFAVERVTPGTNLFRLKVPHDPAAFRSRLASADVALPEPQQGTFVIGVNETWNRATAADLIERFRRAAA